MRNRKLSRRELLMTSTALASVAMVMHPFDAFAQPSAAQGSLIARAKSLELDTPYAPPPGDALEHHAAGFGKIMCSCLVPCRCCRRAERDYRCQCSSACCQT